MRLTRRYRFAASHRLHSPALSEAGNREIYGKCNNPYGHGHDYVLEVSVNGPVLAESGALVDRDRLDGFVTRHVLDRFRHSDLNNVMDAVPTTENLATEIRNRLHRHWSESFPDNHPQLDTIRLHETKRNIFEVSE